jgi:retron-type reverse transcriptase
MIDKILAPGNLQMAWEAVKANQGAPGVDEVTLKRWGRNLETNLNRLAESARANTYHPNRPRRFKVLKKDGTFRELSILTVADRLLQRATLNVLDPIFESRFLVCSHGYRARRSTATAIQQLLTYRDQGYGWLLDADITACFDSLDHAILLKLIKRTVNDWFVLNLTGLWLQAGSKNKRPLPKPPSPTVAENGDFNLRSKIANPISTGVPMGAVLSPLWCNIYLHQMDARLTTAGWKLVRYADDFVVLAESEGRAQAAAEAVRAALQPLGLELSPRKTRLASFDAGFQFLGVNFYRDTYSYTWEQKQVEVQGRNVKWLFKHVPQFY